MSSAKKRLQEIRQKEIKNTGKRVEWDSSVSRLNKLYLLKRQPRSARRTLHEDIFVQSTAGADSIFRARFALHSWLNYNKGVY